jgi:hypothetical protein
MSMLETRRAVFQKTNPKFQNSVYSRLKVSNTADVSVSNMSLNFTTNEPDGRSDVSLPDRVNAHLLRL